MSEELYTYSRCMYCMVYHMNDLNTKYYICKQTLKESCIVHSDPSYNQASYTGFWSFCMQIETMVEGTTLGVSVGY